MQSPELNFGVEKLVHEIQFEDLALEILSSIPFSH